MDRGTRAGILLDLDGTLVDTNYLHTVAWSRALTDVGEWAPMNAIHRLVGMGGDQLVPTLLGHGNDAARERHRARYLELRDEARAFPGARELLRALHERGATVVLATSSPKDDIEVLRAALDADEWIDAVTTADDVDASKPAPDIFRAALEAGRVDPAQVLVLGDTIWDVRAARAAGIGCVAVETGGFSRHELAEDGAVAVYRDVQEVLAQLEVGPLGRIAELAARPRPRPQSFGSMAS